MPVCDVTDETSKASSSALAQWLFNMNVFGIARVSNAVLPALCARGEGRIVSVNSIPGLISSPFDRLHWL
ncbi:SDR family NAD(P)-dependent oxidoreductase [Cupriavidus necator]|uniref:SDR family NAD(P)-dependent oxidoreductase n=1 Tax=Cupriavidus necator TaxID=106590 RepID=UPI0035942EC4